MNAPNLSRMWETYLRIDAKPGKPRAASATLAVIKVLREQVLPYVRRLERYHGVEWYSFLVHDAPEGAPPGAYIHLRISRAAQPHMLPPILGGDLRKMRMPLRRWTQPKRIVAPACREIAGLARTALRSGDIRRAWKLIGEQSAWVLSLLEQHQPDDLAVALHATQFMHYFSNMLQLPSSYPDWRADAVKLLQRQRKKRRP